MKYPQCNSFCDNEHNVHYLGRIKNGQAIDKDEFLFKQDRKCCGCGGIGTPHIGFGYPCSASQTGSHYFNEEAARINAERRGYNVRN